MEQSDERSITDLLDSDGKVGTGLTIMFILESE